MATDRGTLSAMPGQGTAENGARLGYLRGQGGINAKSPALGGKRRAFQNRYA
ncbi:hypothetical protein [Sphingobium psychrophilum]|uniref:hypothetical protein n=1 Tax=Sphingobium psychrophilum TaxID=2728834 RepID=UPI00146EA00F|nr:hypothetical protein [Sphingobium psychrophilum]